MISDSDKPKIRPLNAFPVEAHGRQAICMQDPLRLTDKQVIVDHETYFIISMMDGEHDITDIQLAYTRKFGDLLLNSRINSLLVELDKNLLLESGRLQEAIERLSKEFRKEPLRRAEHVGTAYEEEPEKLRAQLDEVMKLASLENGGKSRMTRLLRGIIAPHIDIRAGAEGYARAYKCVAEAEPADLYVILGVSHVHTAREFVLTDKDFETPLGISRTDKGFVEGLQKSLSMDYMVDELAHKGEHSIEFQVLFLQHVIGDREYRIVPILCSGFHEQVEQDVLPEMDADIREFLDALKEKVEDYPGKVCIIAGVDLSHVGQKFGTPGPLGPTQVKAVEFIDQEMLKIIQRDGTLGFFRHIEEDKNGRNVCGFAAIYSLLYLIKGSKVELLHYGSHYEAVTSSMVSFASMAFC